jgi:hypothetical protein
MAASIPMLRVLLHEATVSAEERGQSEVEYELWASANESSRRKDVALFKVTGLDHIEGTDITKADIECGAVVVGTAGVSHVDYTRSKYHQQRL